MKNSSTYPFTLLSLFVLTWIILAIRPAYPFDWYLENIVVFVLVPFLIILHHNIRFSNTACTSLFIFFVLHIIGAHYTYSEVPVGDSVSAWLGWERNHYDRMVHFLSGFLFFLPVKEIIRKKQKITNGWSNFFTLCIVVSCGIFYEIMEWLTAVIVAPEAGMAFLGIQGDVWDAQKDLSLKLLGCLVYVLASGIVKKFTSPAIKL